MRTLLLLLAVAGATAADDEPRAAFMNTQVSAREICLNQVVQVSFYTLQPQVEGVEADRVIRTSLATPGVTRHWRVVGTPKTVLDERIKTLRVSYDLLPRVAGTLPLPEIPVQWLPGNTVGRMGEVAVLEQIRVGSELRPLPDEILDVGGYRWGMSLEDALKQTGAQDAAVDPATGAPMLTPKPGLDLLFREEVFGTARLTVTDMALDRARQAFLERWGDPIREVGSDQGATIIWMFGWIRVQATGHGDGTVLYLVHEEIGERLDRAAVERKIFDVLDAGDDPSIPEPPAELVAPPGERKPARGDADAAQADATKPDASRVKLEMDDFEREWQRKLEVERERE